MTAAVTELKDKNLYPERTLVLAAFTEEADARFRGSCPDSRLMAGAIAPDAAGVHALALVLEELAR